MSNVCSNWLRLRSQTVIEDLTENAILIIYFEETAASEKSPEMCNDAVWYRRNYNMCDIMVLLFQFTVNFMNVHMYMMTAYDFTGLLMMDFYSLIDSVFLRLFARLIYTSR